MRLLRRHWFAFGLLGVAALTLGEGTGAVAAAGRWAGAHQGAQACVFAMFLLSGLGLDLSRARAGFADGRTVAVSLTVIFVAAPLLAWALGLLPIGRDLRVGLLLIAIMPTTLTSGVVMAGAAGGNVATALVVTVAASWLGIATIPISLEWLLGVSAGSAAGAFDKSGLALRLGLLVVLPLFAGMGLRRASAAIARMPREVPGRLSQGLVLTVVWIAVSRSQATLQQAPVVAALSAALALVFHVALFAAAAGCARLARLGDGRRQVVWFLGAQKTLPIALLIQTAIFPTHGGALVFCVAHHIVHLALDAYLVGRLAAGRGGETGTGGGRPRVAQPAAR